MTMATAKSTSAGKTAAKPSAKAKKATAAKKSAVKKAKPAVAAKSKATSKAPAAKSAPAKSKSAEKSKKPAAKKVPAKAPAKAKAPSKAAKPAAVAKPVAAKPAAAKPAASKPAPAKEEVAKEAAKPAAKPVAPKVATKPKGNDLQGYAIKDYVVYPSHGVGQIIAIEEHEIGDIVLHVFVVLFDKEKMTLRVPLDKASSSGMRKLSSQQTMEQAISTLKGRARTRRVMWSRRAQEYDAKLNSGDPVSIAEVVRDLHRDEGQPDQSYSERQMYEAALERLAREFAAVENTNTEQAAEKLENVLRAA
jgi:CarD family transcriptional regulator